MERVDDRGEGGIINKTGFLNSQKRMGPQAEVAGPSQMSKVPSVHSGVKGKGEIIMQAGQLREFLYGGCCLFYELALLWRMTRSISCRYRKKDGEPENDGVPVKRWNRTP